MSEQTEQEQKKRVETKRTYPAKKAHRKMLELTTTKDLVDMLLRQLKREYKRALQAQKEYEELVKETIVDGIIEPGNEHLDPKDQQDSMTLYSSDGKTRFSIGRQRKRFFDDRSHQAMVYLEDYINDYESRQDDPDSPVILGFVKSLFFSSRKQRQFKWTPELNEFLRMDKQDLHDERLKKAQQILKDSLHVERSKWYSRVEEYDEDEQQYKMVEA